MNEFFRKFAHASAAAVGTPFAFLLGVLVIVLWAVTGPAFHYSDTWQLVINTGTTIVTFLMVFLIQNTQNRHSDAIQIKLDELIRAVAGAHNYLMDLEEATEEELEEFKKHYRGLHEVARRQRERGADDTSAQDLDEQRA